MAYSKEGQALNDVLPLQGRSYWTGQGLYQQNLLDCPLLKLDLALQLDALTQEQNGQPYVYLIKKGCKLVGLTNPMELNATELAQAYNL